MRRSCNDDSNGNAKESGESENGFLITVFAMKLTVFIFTGKCAC